MRGIGFEQKPDYNILRNLLKTLGALEQITFDNNFDWGIEEMVKNKREE